MPFFLDLTACVFYLYVWTFYHVRKCYINLQGEQGRDDEQKLANLNQDKGS